MMCADDGQAPPLRDAASTTPPRTPSYPGGVGAKTIWAAAATRISPRRMDTNQGRAQLLRGNYSNPSPHDIPPRRGPLAIFSQRPGHKFSHRGKNLAKFWVAGVDGHRSWLGAPAQRQPQQPVTTQHPPLGGTRRNYFPRPGHEFSHRGKPLEFFGVV